MSKDLTTLIIDMDIPVYQIRLIKCEDRIIIGLDDGGIIDGKWYIPNIDVDLDTLDEVQLEIDGLKEFFHDAKTYSELSEEKQVAFKLRFC